MAEFIDEARSLTRTIELGPSVSEFSSRLDDVRSSYSRIPDALDDDLKRSQREAAREITLFFPLVSQNILLIVKTQNTLSKVGRSSSSSGTLQKIIDERLQKLNLMQQVQHDNLNELELSVKEGRSPVLGALAE